MTSEIARKFKTSLVAVKKVRQLESTDCGVACLAMAASIPYCDARAVFVEVGISDRYKRRPFSSNFKDLGKALKAAGVNSRMKRFHDWNCVGQAAILKVFVRKNNWHWVFAGRDSELGLFVHDPATDLPSFESIPEDVMCIDFVAYRPSGCFIDIKPIESGNCL